MKSHAAYTLSARPALTAHTATEAPLCAPRVPSRALPSPGLPPQGVSFPHVSVSARTPPVSYATLPGGGPSRSSARGREVLAAPAAESVPQSPDGPHLKPAASPVPRPLGGASVLTLVTARAPGGFTCRGGALGTGAKVCARLGPPGRLSRGPAHGALAPGAGRGGSRLRLAARGGRGGTQCPGPGRAAEAEAEGGESLLGAAWSRQRVPSPGPRPSRWRRAAARGAGVPELSRPVTPAREKQRLEALAGSARSGRRAAGGGEINNARKRKTDVSRARASPASRPGLRSRPRSPPPPPAPLQ